MIRLEDGRGGLFQWDLDCRVVISCPDAEEVHYASPDGTALVTQVYERDWQRVSDIPNICLQQPGHLQVWICTADTTLHKVNFYVTARQKPADYVYTETEVLRWEDLDARLKALETAPGPDWGQNDPDAPDYIRNRTHWAEYEQAEILPVQNISLNPNPYMTQGTLPLVIGQTYTVSWDGREYTCVCGAGSLEGYSTIGIGNAAIYGGGEDTGEPFCIGVVPDLDAWGVFGTDGGSHSLGITGSVEVVHKIPEKFMPDNVFWIDLISTDNESMRTSASPAEVTAAVNAGKEIMLRYAMEKVYYYQDRFIMTETIREGKDGEVARMTFVGASTDPDLFASTRRIAHMYKWNDGYYNVTITNGLLKEEREDIIYWIDLNINDYSTAATPAEVEAAEIEGKQIWARFSIAGNEWRMPLAAKSADNMTLAFPYLPKANTLLFIRSESYYETYSGRLETST